MNCVSYFTSFGRVTSRTFHLLVPYRNCGFVLTANLKSAHNHSALYVPYKVRPTF